MPTPSRIDSPPAARRLDRIGQVLAVLEMLPADDARRLWNRLDADCRCRLVRHQLGRKGNGPEVGDSLVKQLVGLSEQPDGQSGDAANRRERGPAAVPVEWTWRSALGNSGRSLAARRADVPSFHAHPYHQPSTAPSARADEEDWVGQGSRERPPVERPTAAVSAMPSRAEQTTLPDGEAGPLEFLATLAPQQVASLVRGERTPVIAAAIGQLPLEQRLAVLDALAADQRMHIERHMSRSRGFDTRTGGDFAEVLRERAIACGWQPRGFDTGPARREATWHPS